MQRKRKMIQKKDDTKKTTDTEAELVAAVGSGSFELADGTYEGSGTGFGGTITVSVVLKDKTIQSISIVSAPGEDAAFLNRAKELSTVSSHPRVWMWTRFPVQLSVQKVSLQP